MKTKTSILMGAFAASLLNFTSTLQSEPATSLAPAYRIVDLGDLPGGSDDSVALAVNDVGQVVGRVSTASGVRPFLWDAINGMVDLGSLGGDASAADVNNNGVVAGRCGNSYGYRWDATNGMQSLGSGGYSYNSAFGINDSGVIAFNSWSYYGPPGKAFLREGSTNTWIGELYSGAWTIARAINNQNEIVGGSSSSSFLADGYHLSDEKAFHWSQSSGIQSIGSLPPCTNSEATAINNAGQVVGYCFNTPTVYAVTSSTPFLWTANGGMVALESGSIGVSNAQAFAINDGGIVVGYGQINDTNYIAVAWAAGQNAVNLNTLIINTNGWVMIRTAYGVNRSGIIVGEGLRTDGARHAFILYPTTARVVPTVEIKMLSGVVINNAIGSNYLIQATANLAVPNWTTLTNVVVPTQPYIYVDYSSYTNGQQFYRAVPQ